MCTASSSVDNRTTNNHRFVFHCGVVRAHERLYLSEEPYSLDVLPPNLQPMLVYSRSGQTASVAHGDQRDYEMINPSLVRTEISDRGYLPTPPPDDTTAQSPLSAMSTPSLDAQVPAVTSTSISSPLVVRISSRPSNNERDYFSRSTVKSPQHLTSGDVVYWHHLSRNGEIPACCDNGKARGSAA